MADDYSTNDMYDEESPDTTEYVRPTDQDGDTPFSTPIDPVDDPTVDIDVREESGTLDPTHQATDNATDIDSQELYDAGLAAAANASEPNAGNAVVGYDPANDERNNTDSEE